MVEEVVSTTAIMQDMRTVVDIISLKTTITTMGEESTGIEITVGVDPALLHTMEQLAKVDILVHTAPSIELGIPTSTIQIT